MDASGSYGFFENFFNALEDVSTPGQVTSMDDLNAYQALLKRNRSEVTLTPRGIFKALDNVLVPSYNSTDSLASTNYSSNGDLSEYGEGKARSKSGLATIDFSALLKPSKYFQAIEILSIPEVESSMSLSSSQPESKQVKSFPFDDYLFLMKALEEFLHNVDVNDE